MQVSKCRMAARLIAILQLVSTGLIILYYVYVIVRNVKFGETDHNGGTFQYVLIGCELPSLGSAIALLISTLSDGNVCSVTTWVVFKTLGVLLVSISAFVIHGIEYGLWGLVFVSITDAIPIYFVVKYRMELVTQTSRNINMEVNDEDEEEDVNLNC